MAQRQALVLLLNNIDQVLEHSFTLEGVMADAHSGALQAPGTRDSYNIQDSPIRVPQGDLNPAHTGLVFPGAELEKPDLTAFLMDSSIPEEVCQRVNLAVEMTH